MKKRIFEFARQIGINNIGVCSAEYDTELEAMLLKRRSKYGVCEFEEAELMKRVCPKLTYQWAKSIIVCLFPYYISGFEPENISLYSAVTDYHIVAIRYLKRLEQYLKENCDLQSCCICADTGPLCDRRLAYKSGLGFFGLNNQLINDTLGSYFFVGYIICDIELEPDIPLEKHCLRCGKCVRACPGGALSDGFDYKKCISYISQKKELTAAEKRLLKKNNTVWGCDACQKACPHNAALNTTALPEFVENRLDGLKYEEISKMSNKEFLNKYSSYAFSWRGKRTVLKNF